MVYKPSKKEQKQLENLNESYKLIRKGLKLMVENLPKTDLEIEREIYKMSKSFDKIIQKIHKILESKYINKEFLDIINVKDIKKKPKRFRKKDKNIKKLKSSKNKIIKKKSIRRKK